MSTKRFMCGPRPAPAPAPVPAGLGVCGLWGYRGAALTCSLMLPPNPSASRLPSTHSRPHCSLLRVSVRGRRCPWPGGRGPRAVSGGARSHPQSSGCAEAVSTEHSAGRERDVGWRLWSIVHACIVCARIVCARVHRVCMHVHVWVCPCECGVCLHCAHVCAHLFLFAT